MDGVPAAPSAPSVRVAAPDRVRLTWRDRSDNETGFVIARSHDYERRFATVALVGPDSTEYVDTGVTVGRTYRYRVYAFNPAGRSRTRVSGLLRFAPPPAPDHLEAVALSDFEVRLQWSHPSAREEGFLIERSADGTKFEPVATPAAGAERFLDQGLGPAATYHYRVSAVNVVGGSAPSAVATATTRPADVVYSGPVVITAGGTYTGNWQSLDSDVAAVTIRTTEPVVIEKSNVRGREDLIETDVEHTRVTVRDTRGYGLNPNVYGQAAGRFFDATYFDSAEVINNYMEGTGGIKLQEYLGDGTVSDSIRVVGNSALNIDGRKSDGNGGHLDFNKRTRLSDGVTEEGFEVRQFVQLRKVHGVPAVEIAWNQVINEPGRSRVEDNINVYKSSGTADSPIRIHDNYVQGAYTIEPWRASYRDDTWEYSWRYSGGGILVGDGSTDTAYVEAYDNQVVSTSNYGVAIASGHDMVFHHNRVLSSGLLPDGRPITAQNVGVYIWDLYGQGPGAFYNNSARDNLVGWMNGARRNDWWVPDATSFENNTACPGELTPAAEAAELAVWRAKVDAAGGTIGPAA